MKRRRKRKKRYHTGMHTSTKTGVVYKYRSSWELSYMQYLDSEPSVLSYEYERIVIPYVSNVRSGKMRKYYPDFIVKYVDGHDELIEIKPLKRLHNLKVQKKLAAAGDYCRAHGVTLRVITERELKDMGLLK